MASLRSLSGDYRKLAGLIVLSVGSLWAAKRLLRALALYFNPRVLPGEENTALLASPLSTNSSGASEKDFEGAAEYDYILIGAGTAGCVIAARLTEDPNVSVLAIESGHSDQKQLFSRIPAAFAQLFGTAADHDLRTTKQTNCADRELYWPRGKMIGGCSAINAMIYNRGAPDDYDEWARLGNDGWSFRDLQPYMNKAETFNQPSSNSSSAPLPQEDFKEHGHTGPWQTGYSFISPISRVFVDACAALGFPKIDDFNTSKGINGASMVQTFIDKQGQRSSTAAAYLTADVCSRPNLKIASGQTVTRIVFDQSGAKPKAIGVEMASDKKALVRYLAKARKEVILSAGAVHSPHILQLSGIGPSKELSAHGVPVVKDLPGVGNNLVDHLFNTLQFECPKGSSLQFLADPLASLSSLIQWFRNGSGPMTSNVGEGIAFCRTADRRDAPDVLRINDKSSGPSSADLEILCAPIAYVDHGKYKAPANDYFSLGPIMLRPVSRGTIRIASADPFTPPIIDPNYLSTQHDVDLLLYGLKLSHQIARSDPFKPYFKSWFWPEIWQDIDSSGNYDKMSDETLVRYIRATCETLYHPMGTCKMGSAQDAMAVVDSKLLVHGIDGLRIADASIFPMPVGCHPCAPVVMVGEKAADLIKTT